MRNEKVYFNISDLPRFPVGSYAIWMDMINGNYYPVTILGLSETATLITFKVVDSIGKEHHLHADNLMTLEEYENV